MLGYSVWGKLRKECNRFRLRLRCTLILILNDRTSASKKINLMALVKTLTVPTIAFEREKIELYGLQQNVLSKI